MFLSFLPCPMLLKEQGKLKKKEKRAISMAFVFYYILIIFNISFNSM